MTIKKENLRERYASSQGSGESRCEKIRAKTERDQMGYRLPRCMKNKTICISIILALFINILCLPLWTECDYVGFIRSLFNKEARLDLLYSGKITHSEPFQYKVTPQPFYASWVYESGTNVHRVNLSLRARGEWQKLSLQLKAQRDGKITMLFRGPDVQNGYGASYSVLTDWRNVKLNGKTILSRLGAFSFKKPYTKQLSVKKGDVLHIEAEFRRHHFSIHDFAWLRSGKVWYIITGNLLFFSLIYPLLTYLAKRCETFCPSNMLLLVGFFLPLFIPMIRISDEVKSVRELRTLAVKPELKDLFKERSDYGRRYENYFNDHFCGRVPLMKIHDVFRNKLSSVIRTEKALYFKKSGWIFLVPLISDLDCRPSFLQSTIQNLVRLNEFCQQHQIKLYVLETPKKEVVYKELIKENYGFDEKKLDKVSQAQEFIRNEVRKHHIPYIYPYKALCAAAKSDYVFFKWTHHWTDWGAYVGYCELMKEIGKDFPDMPIVSLNDFQKHHSWLIRDMYNESLAFTATRRQFYHFFNYGDEDDPPNRAIYNYYDHNNRAKMVFKVGKFIKDFSYPKGKHKVMVVGSSNNENLNHFLPYSAAELKYIRVIDAPVKATDQFKIIKLYKKDILNFKPDILILSIGPENLSRLRDLCASK